MIPGGNVSHQLTIWTHELLLRVLHRRSLRTEQDPLLSPVCVRDDLLLQRLLLLLLLLVRRDARRTEHGLPSGSRDSREHGADLRHSLHLHPSDTGGHVLHRIPLLLGMHLLLRRVPLHLRSSHD